MPFVKKKRLKSEFPENIIKKLIGVKSELNNSRTFKHCASMVHYDKLTYDQLVV